jgi:hypothetical protein
MRPVAGIRIATGVAAASLVLAGCTTTQSAGPPAPASVRLTEASLAVLAEDGSYASDEAVLHRADEALVQRCMIAHGRRYVSQPYAPGSMGSLTDDEEHPDMVWRRAVGYSLRPAAGNAPGGNDRYLATLSAVDRAKWERTLKGDGTRMTTLQAPSGRTFTSPLDGCIAASAAQVYGTPEQASRVLYYPQDVRFGLQARMREGAGYLAAAGRWAECMRRQGHPFATPGAARKAMATRYQAAGPVAAAEALERSVAVADGKCVTGAGLGTAAGDAVRRLARTLTDDMRAALNAVASVRRRGIVTAEKILAEQ